MSIKEKNNKSVKKYLSNPKNREKHRKQCREYCETNKEKIKLKRNTPEYRERENIRKNTPESREFSKQWQKDNKEILHLRLIKKKYKVDYATLFEEQNGCCKICKRHQSEFKKKLAVDHCHETNTVRGLLCPKCNTGIGQFNDDIELMKIAIKYLKNKNK